jgi:hypothetical protein
VVEVDHADSNIFDGVWYACWLNEILQNPLQFRAEQFLDLLGFTLASRYTTDVGRIDPCFSGDSGI